MDIGGPEILIVLLVVVLLFGGSKLPKLARSLGSAKGEFEKGVREGTKSLDEGEKAEPAKATDTKAVETTAVEATPVEVPDDPKA